MAFRINSICLPPGAGTLCVWSVDTRHIYIYINDWAALSSAVSACVRSSERKCDKRKKAWRCFFAGAVTGSIGNEFLRYYVRRWDAFVAALRKQKKCPVAGRINDELWKQKGKKKFDRPFQRDRFKTLNGYYSMNEETTKWKCDNEPALYAAIWHFGHSNVVIQSPSKCTESLSFVPTYLDRACFLLWSHSNKAHVDSDPSNFVCDGVRPAKLFSYSHHTYAYLLIYVVSLCIACSWVLRFLLQFLFLSFIWSVRISFVCLRVCVCVRSIFVFCSIQTNGVQLIQYIIKESDQN